MTTVMASDYRGPALNTLTQVNSQNSTMKTYAGAIATRPRKEQAVIIESLEGYTNDDYIDGLEKLVQPTDIRFMSKISGARVCVFLANEKLVEHLTNKTVQVKDSLLKIRPFIEKNKRVVISNVNPIIPDEVVLNALKNKGIIPVSSIHGIKASLTKPGRAHILSFRRQVYIKEQDEKMLPESLEIFFEDTKYWIYLSTNSTLCFICKQNGHIAKQCPNIDTHTTHTQPSNSTINEEDHECKQSENLEHNTNKENSQVSQLKAVKRPPPPSTTSDSSINVRNNSVETTKQSFNSNEKK